MVPKSAGRTTASPDSAHLCWRRPSSASGTPSGAQVGMAQFFCSRGGGLLARNRDPVGSLGPRRALAGGREGRPSPVGWKRWMEGASTGAGLGGPGVSPRLA